MDFQKISDGVTHPVPAASTAGSVILAHFAGWTLPDIVEALSGVYMIILIAHKLYVWHYEIKQKRPLNESDE